MATSTLLTSSHPPGLRIVDGRMELTREVLSQNERVGTLYLAAAYEESSGLRDYAGIVGLVTVLSLAATATSWQRPCDACPGPSTPRSSPSRVGARKRTSNEPTPPGSIIT